MVLSLSWREMLYHTKELHCAVDETILSSIQGTVILIWNFMFHWFGNFICMT